MKDDQKKSRVDLIPSQPLIEVGHVLRVGAMKYGDHNWRRGMAWSRLYSAALRHMYAWFDGQDIDEESGMSHLAHATCCLLFLMEFQSIRGGLDDRYKNNFMKEELSRNG